jgi:hypothetical protein
VQGPEVKESLIFLAFGLKMLLISNAPWKYEEEKHSDFFPKGIKMDYFN